MKTATPRSVRVHDGRGRKARSFHLSPEHQSELQQIASGSDLRARRARVLLQADAKLPVHAIAEQSGMDAASVWRLCRRYEARGLDALHDAPRSGRRPKEGTA